MQLGLFLNCAAANIPACVRGGHTWAFLSGPPGGGAAGLLCVVTPVLRPKCIQVFSHLSGPLGWEFPAWNMEVNVGGGGEQDQDGGLWEPRGGDPDPGEVTSQVLIVPSVSLMPLV